MSSLPILAGVVSTIVFASSTLPMVIKAATTRDLGSYSLGNLALVNVGNVVHSFYVFHLPLGPIWVLHGFHVTTSLLMLVWYLRFAGAAPTTKRRTPCPPLLTTDPRPLATAGPT